MSFFSTGESCNRTLFVNSKMRYTYNQVTRMTGAASQIFNGFSSTEDENEDDSNNHLPHPSWLSEPALWTIWTHCGMLMALEDACMYALQVKTFLKQIAFYKEVRIFVTLYAKQYVQQLQDGIVTDLPECVDIGQVWAKFNQDVQKLRESWTQRGEPPSPGRRRSKRASIVSGFLEATMGRPSVTNSATSMNFLRLPRRG